MDENKLKPLDKIAFDAYKWADPDEDQTILESTPRERWRALAVVLALMVAAAAYRAILAGGFGRTGLLFIGLPALLAAMVVWLPRSRTNTGSIMKAITLLLLIVAPLVGEGYLCILIASPLFYAVGAVVGGISDAFARKGKSRGSSTGCIAILMLPMCLEGVSPQLSFRRAQMVTVTRVVHAPEASVAEALAGSMQVKRALPGFLRIGFPHPVVAWGSGLQVGDERGLHFTGAEGTPPGDLRMRVAESRAGYVRMQTVADGSKVTEWLHWRDTEVEWRALDASHTQVTARVHFDRGLDPAWYFTAWERFAARKAAEYLITANATPEGVQ